MTPSEATQAAAHAEAQAQIAEGGMKLVGGIFDIASGRVRFLS
jgi:hypothetical protein